jgi:hypothetical protein
MCCTPTITFDKLVTVKCGRCGKEFIQPLPENATYAFRLKQSLRAIIGSSYPESCSPRMSLSTNPLASPNPTGALQFPSKILRSF